MEPSGAYSRGTQGTAVVRLTAKGGYKINDEYPFRFECQTPASDGISYPKPTLTQTDATVTEREAVFPIAFVPSKPGHLNVGGSLSLSVCNDQHCVIDKKVLVTQIVVP